MLQSIALIFTLLAAFFSLLAGFKAQPLIPSYQFRLFDLRTSLNKSNATLKELISFILEELDKSNITEVKASSLLYAKLKNLDESLESSISNLQEGGKANIFDESKPKAGIRLYYILSFGSIIIAILLQSILLFPNG